MNKLGMLGDSGERKSRFNPDLAEQLIKDMEEKERKENLKEKLRKLKAKSVKEEPLPETGSSPKQPIIQAPSFTDAFFLGDKLGEEINAKIQGKYGKFEAISKIVYDNSNKLVIGSNPFYVVAANEFLISQGIRTATQADLEKILREDKLELKGNYEDSALVWRSNAEPNKFLAEDIYRQFKAKGMKLNEGTAYVIPLYTLRLREDEHSPYKLAFELTDETLKAYFEAHILMSKTGKNINPDDMNESTGLPNKIYDNSFPGNRQLWTINSGLARLYLSSSLYLGSCDEDLAFSYGRGRVACLPLRAEGTSPDNLSSIGNRGK